MGNAARLLDTPRENMQAGGEQREACGVSEVGDDGRPALPSPGRAKRAEGFQQSQKISLISVSSSLSEHLLSQRMH